MTKVDIFSGFLGAGKTTLIKKLISEKAYGEEKLVLIENEFGEIGVDTGFLRDTGIEINEMTAGCICCTLVGDFAKALNQVVAEYHPDCILIEPSGVGKLSDVIIAVQELDNPEIELGSFTTVVDAARYKSYMKNFGEFYKNQVECAGTIIISHQSKLAADELEECNQAIRGLNPEANIITTDWDELDAKTILAEMQKPHRLADKLAELRAEAMEELEEHEHHHHHHECSCEHHEHDHEHEHKCECHHEHHEHHEHSEETCSCGCGHHHHGHDADEVFEEFGQTTTVQYSKAELEEILDSLEECGEILRAKGIVASENGKWLEFDYVPGEGEVRESEASATGMICVIGTHIKQDKIKALFNL